MPISALVQLAKDHGFAAAANNSGLDISIEWVMGDVHGVDVVHCQNIKELMWAMGY